MRETRIGRRPAGKRREKGARCVYPRRTLPASSQHRIPALAEESKTVLGPAVVRQEPGLSGAPDPGEPGGKPRDPSGAFFWREREWKRREPSA